MSWQPVIERLIGTRPQQDVNTCAQYSSTITPVWFKLFASLLFSPTDTHQSGHQSTSKHVSLILCKHGKGWRKLPLHNWATSSYLSKVPDIKKVEGLKQLAFPHAKHVAARQQERPDVLQAQKLCWEDRKGWSSVWAIWHPAAWVQKRLLLCSDWWDRAANTPEDDSSKGWLNRIYGLHESVCFH